MSLPKRLRERKLVQWALAYAAGAFAVFQAVEVLAEPWGISPPAQRITHVLLTAGFLLVLILAWYHGEKGHQRVSRTELVLIAVILVAAGGAISWFGRDGGQAPPATLAAPAGTVAVLSFDNFGADSSYAYLGMGIAEELIHALVRVPGLAVKSRTSAFALSGQGLTLGEIARRLQVRNVVEGSFQQSGDRVQVTAQLINAVTDDHLWSEVFETEAKDILSIREEIARAVAEALQDQLLKEITVTPGAAPPPPRSPSGVAVVGPTTDDPVAWNLYRQGRFLWERRTRADVLNGLRLFQAAIARDPGFGIAYAGLADAFLTLGNYGWLAPLQSYPQAEVAARTALELDPSLASAHTTLGGVDLYHTRDWEGAERHFRRALELDRHYALAHLWYGELLEGLGRTEGALAHFEAARDSDPLSPQVLVGLAAHFESLRDYPRAIEETRRALELHPGFANGHYQLCRFLILAGTFEEAQAACRQAAVLWEVDPALLSAYVGIFSGNREEGLRVAREALRSGAIELWTPVLVAEVFANLGELDEAFAWLEKARDGGHPYLNWLPGDPFLDPLRADPRFPAFLADLRLPLP